jgi:hypothetical protein
MRIPNAPPGGTGTGWGKMIWGQPGGPMNPGGGTYFYLDDNNTLWLWVPGSSTGVGGVSGPGWYDPVGCNMEKRTPEGHVYVYVPRPLAPYGTSR